MAHLPWVLPGVGLRVDPCLESSHVVAGPAPPVNVSALLLSWVSFSGVAYLLDSVFHALGPMILTQPGVEGLRTLPFFSVAIKKIE